MNHNCPVCHSDSSFLGHGVVAPWVVVLLGFDSKTFIPTTYMGCNRCSINFFSYRYSKVELGAIYKDYRKDSRFNLRNSFEPWYRRTTNNAYIDQNASTNIAIRSAYTEGLLSLAGLDISDLGDYLDFGGDNGQFFPRGVKGRRILFDLQSGINDGVEKMLDTSNTKITYRENNQTNNLMESLNLNLNSDSAEKILGWINSCEQMNALKLTLEWWDSVLTKGKDASEVTRSQVSNFIDNLEPISSINNQDKHSEGRKS